MTVEERVLAALHCQQPDRVPIFLFLDPYTPNWATNDPSYSELMKYTAEYADVIYDWGVPEGFFYCPDVKVENVTLENGQVELFAETPKGRLSYGRGQMNRWIKTEEDVEKLLSIPYRFVEPNLSTFFQTKSILGDKVVAQVTLSDPICIAGMIRPESLAIWTKTEREMLIELLDLTFERLCQQLDYLLRNGVGPVYYFNGPEFAIPPLMSPHDFDEFVVKYDSQLIAKIHEYGYLTIIHSHGKVNSFLEKFAFDIGTDGLNVLEPPPMGDVDLADAKRRIGHHTCLIGNIQYDDFARCSKDEIEQLVKASILKAGPGGGFILCPCAAPYERPIPRKTADNFIHYIKMGRKYGRYPIDCGM